MPLALRQTPDGVLLPVRVQPRASRTAVTGVREGVLRLAITAPPVDGEANKAVLAFVAELLGVAKSGVTLAAGEKGRDKTVLIRGAVAAEVAAALAPYVERS